MTICAFTPFCEPDVDLWAGQYLAECERLDMPFVVHLDRCSKESWLRFKRHRLCRGITRQDIKLMEYTEQHKQMALDEVTRLGYDWALHWDSDETWETNAPAKLTEICATATADYLQVLWVNLWGDDGHIRVDAEFNRPPRVKLYNLQDGRRWHFDHPITYGCKLVDGDGTTPHGHGAMGTTDLACLHHGLKTEELRKMHAERWDRIYGKAVGSNPYGFWHWAMNQAVTPHVIENPY